MQVDRKDWVEQYCHKAVNDVTVGDTLALGIEQEYHRHYAYHNPQERIIAYGKVEATEDKEEGCHNV